MSQPRPPFGLLLDVDGPIASPVDRAITEPTIVPDLLTLLAAGCPVVFNTGRSDEFLRTQVVAPLLAAGVPENARMHGVCEKGAVWFAITDSGLGAISVDHELALPAEFGRRIEELVDDRYADKVFYDHTKRAMVSVEQHLHVPAAEYHAMRDDFDRDALAVFADLDLGARLMDIEQPDSRGEVHFRIDPTIISTDIESVVLGKDRGAERALQLLAADGSEPEAWRTVGDSRTDYAMADWLHEQGKSVAHVDVRPADGVMAKPYPVLVAQASVNDVAGARYLARLRQIVEGASLDEAAFDA